VAALPDQVCCQDFLVEGVAAHLVQDFLVAGVEDQVAEVRMALHLAGGCWEAGSSAECKVADLEVPASSAEVLMVGCSEVDRREAVNLVECVVADRGVVACSAGCREAVNLAECRAAVNLVECSVADRGVVACSAGCPVMVAAELVPQAAVVGVAALPYKVGSRHQLAARGSGSDYLDLNSSDYLQP